MEKSQPLRIQFTGKKIDASCVAPGAAKAGDKTEPDWVFGRGGSAARYRNDTHLPLHQISRQLGQPVILTIRPTILDCDVLTLEVASFTKTLPERTQEPCIRIDSAGVEHPNHRHRSLLRTRRERPCGSAAGRCY